MSNHINSMLQILNNVLNNTNDTHQHHMQLDVAASVNAQNQSNLYGLQTYTYHTLDNTYIGYHAGLANTTGTNNIFIGAANHITWYTVPSPMWTGTLKIKKRKPKLNLPEWF